MHNSHRKQHQGMIRIILSIICLALLWVQPSITEATMNREVQVYVDGIDVEFSDGKPYVDRNYRVMVPIRSVVEAVGAKVQWNDEQQQVTITKNGVEVVLTVDESSYTVNGQKKQMDTAMVYNRSVGTNFVPIRFVLEAIGAEVEWQMIEGKDVVRVQAASQKQSQALPLIHDKKESLTGIELLLTIAQTLEIPNNFYFNTSIEYFAEEPTVTDHMQADMTEYLNKFQYAETVSVLTYHHLLTESENQNFKNNSAVISVERFEQHMEILHKNAYQTYELQVLEDFIKGKQKLPQKTVFITFDDGYLSNYVHAYPFLKKHNFTAAIFAITSMVREAPETWNPNQLNFISWEEIDQYKDVFQVESHTHDLHRLQNNISQVITEPYLKILQDFADSKQRLAASYFAYPYGQYDMSTVSALKNTGYRLAFTNKPGTISPHSDSYQLNRFGMYPDTTVDKFKEIIGIEEITGI